MRHTPLAALLFLLGGAAGIPLGFALSQTAPQMRVQVLLQQRVTDIPRGPHNVKHASPTTARGPAIHFDPAG